MRFLLFLALFLLASLNGEGAIKVIVSLGPHRNLIEKIAEDKVEALLIVHPEQVLTLMNRRSVVYFR